MVATLDDYGAVRGLVADILSEGVEATVSSTIRETVAAVAALLSPANLDDTVSVAALAKHLGLDKSAASRRVRVSLDRGFLTNAETRKGRPSRLSVGDPMPENTPILPTVETLRDRCSVAVDPEGIKTPLPSTALVPSAMLAEVRP